MIDVKAAATRKIGPLPAWAWGGIVGASYLVYRTLRGGGSSPSAVGNVVPVGGPGGFDPRLDDGFSDLGGSIQPPIPVPGTNPPAPIVNPVFQPPIIIKPPLPPGVTTIRDGGRTPVAVVREIVSPSPAGTATIIPRPVENAKLALGNLQDADKKLAVAERTAAAQRAAAAAAEASRKAVAAAKAIALAHNKLAAPSKRQGAAETQAAKAKALAASKTAAQRAKAVTTIVNKPLVPTTVKRGSNFLQ